MKKTYLLTPGPTPIPERVSAVLGQGVMHHRTPEFQALFQEIRDGLKYLFQTKQEVLAIAATGTGCMDATVSNLFRKGDTVITVNGGKFGARWTKIAQVYGLNAAELKLDPGQSLDLAALESLASANKGARAILFQASETSTGVQLPTREITEIARKHGMLSVCDAITACGVFELPMDAWGIDVMITGSQKALMIPPGLSFIALSPKAWKATETSDLPKFYFDLRKELKAHEKNQTAWTPATGLLMGAHESLKMIREEGLENIFKRHDGLARATRNAVQALGLEILAKKSPSAAVTSVLVPSTIQDGKLIPRTMRDAYGVTIAGGQDELEGKIFRLSHFGYCGKFDITTGISCLELVLHKLGHPVKFGTGVGAALRTFSEES